MVYMAHPRADSHEGAARERASFPYDVGPLSVIYNRLLLRDAQSSLILKVSVESLRVSALEIAWKWRLNIICPGATLIVAAAKRRFRVDTRGKKQKGKKYLALNGYTPSL